MATAIQKRVEALEVSHGGGGWGECGDCGGSGWDDPDRDDVYELIIDDGEYEELYGESAPEEDVYCSGCGQIAVHVLKYDDVDPKKVQR